jgi:oxygen-independent coproporphyrinogen III oxidase
MDLITKHNIPVPRYTSYPTVPAWQTAPGEEEWKRLVADSFRKTNSTKGISVYIHLPFCESLCTYCACNTRITVNHKVEEPYIAAVLKEWDLYTGLFKERPRIKELHLGGGTPTFFSAKNLARLIEGILAKSGVCENADFSFEGHPSNTTSDHLQTLFDLGFRRVSFGIQDFDPKVQEVINRYQSYEQVLEVVNHARRIGYRSINFDLVYGLPYQRLETITETINRVIELHPDRIAFYSYAHVPWMRPGQRKFTERDLPVEREKRALYEKGLEQFKAAGYHDIGMDHFALPGDELHSAMLEGTLHRNFMGYTHHHTELMVSMGVSAISDTWNGFGQNIKVVEAYSKTVNEGRFPIMKGHVLTAEDECVRRHILDIMCQGKTQWQGDQHVYSAIADGLRRARDLAADGLVILEEGQLTVTTAGKSFLRNICLCFDYYFWQQPLHREGRFSAAV